MAELKRAYIMTDVILSAVRDNNPERHHHSKKLVAMAKSKGFVPVISDLIISELNAMADDTMLETLKTVLLDLNPEIALFTEETHALAQQYENLTPEDEGQEEPEDGTEDEPDEPEDEPDELMDKLNLLKKKISFVYSKMSFEEIKQDLEKDFAELDKRLNGTLSQLLKNQPG